MENVSPCITSILLSDDGKFKLWTLQVQTFFNKTCVPRASSAETVSFLHRWTCTVNSMFSWILFQFNTITIFDLVLFVVNKYLMVFIPFQCLNSTAAMILCETCEVGFCERGAWSMHGCKIYSDNMCKSQITSNYQQGDMILWSAVRDINIGTSFLWLLFLSEKFISSKTMSFSSNTWILAKQGGVRDCINTYPGAAFVWSTCWRLPPLYLCTRTSLRR